MIQYPTFTKNFDIAMKNFYILKLDEFEKFNFNDAKNNQL